jgi:hypothetical protein
MIVQGDKVLCAYSRNIVRGKLDCGIESNSSGVSPTIEVLLHDSEVKLPYAGSSAVSLPPLYSGSNVWEKSWPVYQ